MNDLRTHPNPEQLAAYGLGKLEDLAADQVHQHLEACPGCRTDVAAVPDDTLASLVRASATVVDERAHLSPGPDSSGNGTQDQTPVPADLPVQDKTLAYDKAGKDSGEQPASLPATDTLLIPGPLVDHPRYHVLDLLGAGGMGAVYKAEHRLMGRLVALKVINPRLVNRPGMGERFHREVHAAARLSHPNIAAAHDAEQASDTHFLVMEFIEGQSLAQLVAQQGPLPVAQACDYTRQAALGLEHAHRRGMVHRDIKPHNLMVTPEGQVKVLDFGLAHFVSENVLAESITEVGSVMGTPDYIAPEQARDAHRADIRADIYSLGCTLYFLLTGQPPFPEGTAMGKLTAHLERTPKSLSAWRVDVPPGLQHAIEKMMAKDPNGRYQTPAEVEAALAPFASAAVPTTRLPRRRWPWAAAVVFLGALGVGGYLFGPTVYRIGTDRGQLVIETEDPDVEVVVKQGGQEVKIIDTKANREVTLKAGTYQVELVQGKERLQLSTSQFTLERGGREIVKVRLEAAMAAGAPGRQSGSEVRQFVGHTGPVDSAGGAPATGVDEAWIKSVAALLAESQVQEVARKLQELNPGFDGKLTPYVTNGVVWRVDFTTDRVTTISPVRALKGLRQLVCAGTGDKGMLTDLEPLKGLSLDMLLCANNPRLTDLSPLHGMPLKALFCGNTQVFDLTPLTGMPLTLLHVGTTRVHDLSPLKGMPLEVLHCYSTRVHDLAPLKDLPLKEVKLDFLPRRDAEVLRSIKTLERINDKPAKEFWKEVDAEAPGSSK